MAVFALAIVITVFTPYVYIDLLTVFPFFISMLLVYFWAPVEYGSHLILQDEREKYRNISLCLSMGHAVVLMMGPWIFSRFKRVFLMASLGSLSAALAMLIALILERQGRTDLE